METAIQALECATLHAKVQLPTYDLSKRMTEKVNMTESLVLIVQCGGNQHTVNIIKIMVLDGPCLSLQNIFFNHIHSKSEDSIVETSD